MRAVIAVVLLAVAGVSQAEALVPDTAFAVRWLDEGYLARHNALQAAADQFSSASAAFCSKPAAATLADARNAYGKALLAWRSMDGATAGPNVLERTGRKIDFRPTRVADIESAISDGKGVDALNVATRGLPAAEYLLWGDRQPTAQLNKLKKPARCAYLTGSAAQIVTDVHALDEGWATYRKELAGEEAFFRNNLFPETVGLMLAGLEGTLRRLPRVDDAKIEAYADWRSDVGKAAVSAQLEGFAVAYFGAGKDKASLAGFLVDHDKAAVNTRVLAALDNARALLKKMPQKIDAPAGAATRKAFIKAVADIKHVVEGDVAEALDITLGFNDSDGD
ncbi:hypothetical protein IGB42_00809 [Andreprevotia sp. IGB-42]|uniref:imelysin family protein n=1 Tax=Andreprevotia sp. IGB-42 TaxID=2497473 RepID=UPI0013593262|nr:imelysin family protein [Andreprevotia sp. IGB-42]KAF0814754.1 hypothetical protein IGB42_00809 [Andreprevotia sp. IGB-42]